MARQKRELSFRIMSLAFAIRDMILPPMKVLREAGLRAGERVLDFGCGPGSYTIASSKLVGEQGRVYALDKNPLALDSVKRRAMKADCSNIETIESDGPTGLPDGSTDAVLLFDTFHELEEQEQVLTEIYRVLAPNGRLCFSDHHMKAAQIIRKITESGLFKLAHRGRYTFVFVKA